MADLEYELSAVARSPPGAVSAVWAPSSTLPEVAHRGVGLLIAAFPATTDPGLIEKELPPGAVVRVVRVGTNAGYWIEGPHTFHYVAPDGTIDMDSSRL